MLLIITLAPQRHLAVTELIRTQTLLTASNFLSIRVLTRHPRSALSYLLNQTKMMCIWVINGNEGILKTVINQRDSCGVTLMKKASVS